MQYYKVILGTNEYQYKYLEMHKSLNTRVFKIFYVPIVHFKSMFLVLSY